MQIGMVVTDLDGTLLDARHALSAGGSAHARRAGRARHRARDRDRALAVLGAARTAGRSPDRLPGAHLGRRGAELARLRTLRATTCAELASELAARARGQALRLHAAPRDPGQPRLLLRTAAASTTRTSSVACELYAPYAQRAALAALARARDVSGRGHRAARAEPARRAARRAAQFQVIRTTSPLDGASPGPKSSRRTSARRRGPLGCATASSSAARHAASRSATTTTIWTCCSWADRAYVVANAPSELRARYVTVARTRERLQRSGPAGLVPKKPDDPPVTCTRRFCSPVRGRDSTATRTTFSSFQADELAGQRRVPGRVS